AVAMAPERGDRSLPPTGTEGLPRVFLQSLRTLFDILDDRRRGYVHLREIESRWRGAEARELPAGVMEGLRRAAPASGYLTFERFVLGLRAALPGADPPLESGGGRRSAEKPPNPRGAEERRGKSGGQREPGHGPHRGRGELGAGAGRNLPGSVRAAPERGQRHRRRLQARWGPGARSGPPGGAALFPPLGLNQQQALPAGLSQGDGSHPGAGDTRRHQRGRAEHRRHTITNGVDFSMVR
ncbi:SAPC2 protein, partial [Larus smithsonianus]|nr:SAPC2 protein [Larus smithsonianus]